MNRHPLTKRLAKAGPGRPKGSKNKVTQEWVEKHLRYRVSFDPRRLLAKIGRGKNAIFTLKEIAELPDELAMCIESYDVIVANVDQADGALETAIKVRWYNKDKPLELCARSVGMLKDKLEVSASGEAIALLDAWKRGNRVGSE